MSNFKIISDTSCDIPKELVEEYDIGLVPFNITFDGGATYLKEGIDIDSDELCEKMQGKDVFPKTSLPSVMDYTDAFKPHLLDGRDVFCVCLSSKFSGSYQSAVNAAEMLLEEFPERKIKVVDSLLATFLQGLLVIDVAEYRKEGKGVDEIFDLVESYKNEGFAYLTVDTLEYLQKGGRIGKAAALAGGILNIKPIIVLEHGALSPHSKARGRKKALAEVVELTANFLKGKENEYRAWVLSSGFEEDAKAMADLMQEKGVPVLGIGKIGATITVHGGPGVTGIVVLRNRP